MRAWNKRSRKQARTFATAGALTALTMASAFAWASPNAESTGLTALIDRIGSAPSGVAVEAVGQVEAPSGSNYAPDEGHSQFSGKTIVESSGPSGVSNHATTVAKELFGSSQSIAPGIDKAYIYEVNDWLGTVLRLGTNSVPISTPSDQKVINHSWVGSAGGAWDNQILRRADYVVVRDDVIMCIGVNNADPAYPLMAYSYNGITVGTTDGTHASTPVPSGYDGPGRAKPELIAPGSDFTSFVTPVVGAAAALLVETARTDSHLAANADAERSDVIKAVLLCGADRSGSWTNNPITTGGTRGWTDLGLDEVYGAGNLWVDDSHLILTGGETNGENTVPTDDTITGPGWARDVITIGESSHWRFTLDSTSDVDFLATWHRKTNTSFSASYIADFDLSLWSASGGKLSPLLGEGRRVFGGGNVVSESAVDNVELIRVTDLAPGEYVLQVSRIDGVSSATSDVAVAWKIPESQDEAPSADFNADGFVNITDFGIFLVNFGRVCDPTETCLGDLNGDLTVNVADFSLFLVAFGTTTSG